MASVPSRVALVVPIESVLVVVAAAVATISTWVFLIDVWRLLATTTIFLLLMMATMMATAAE